MEIYGLGFPMYVFSMSSTVLYAEQGKPKLNISDLLGGIGPGGMG